MIETIILPYEKLHFVLFQNSLAVATVSIVMLIVDIFHFNFVYKNELSYYLVEDNQILVNKENLHSSDNKMNDLKWL